MNNKSSQYTLDINLLPFPAFIYDKNSIYLYNNNALRVFKLPKLFSVSPLKISEVFSEKSLKNLRSAISKLSDKNNIVSVASKNNQNQFAAHIKKVVYNKKTCYLSILIPQEEPQNTLQNLLHSAESNAHIIFNYETKPAPHLCFVSKSVKTILGYNSEEFISGGKKFYDKILVKNFPYNLPFDSKKFLSFINKNKTVKEPLIAKNGKVIWFESSYSTIKNSKGEVTNIVGIARDITPQVDAEKRLEDAEKQIQLIAENAHDIIYFFTYLPKPKYLFISDSVEHVLGYKTEDFYKDSFFLNKRTVGKNNGLKKHEKEAPNQQKKGVLKWKKVVYRVKNHSGEPVWMEDHVTPIFDDNGKISFLFGIVRNINELKLKEQELSQKWSDYKLLLDESPIAFYIHHNGICLMCNKAGVNLVKAKSEKEVVGKQIINYIIPEQRERALQRVKKALSGKEQEFLAYKIKDRKNNILQVEIKTVPITYNGINCVLSLVKDVTQQEAIEKKRLKAEIIEEHNLRLLEEISKRKEAEQKLLNQRNKLSAIFENSQHVVWTINKNYEFTYFNKNFERLFHEKRGTKPIIGKSGRQLIHKKEQTAYDDFWLPHYKKAFSGKSTVFELVDYSPQGKEIVREVFVNPIFNESGQVVEVSCMAKDISLAKLRQKQLVEQAVRISSIFDSGDQTIWTVDKEFRYTSFNNNFIRAFIDSYDNKPKIGQTFLEAAQKHHKVIQINTFWEDKYKQVLQGKSIEFVYEIERISGKRIVRRFYLQPIFNENKQVVEISGLGKEITEEVYTQQKMITQAAKLNSIFEGSSHYVWTVDRENKLTSFNQNYTNLLNKVYNSSPQIGQKPNRGKMIENQSYVERLELHYKKAFTGEKVNFELELNTKNGESIFLDVFLNPVEDGNQIVEVAGIAHDITGVRLNEQKIVQSLKEKEVLLKEVHHRVKNNMQIISSILNLQSSYIHDENILSLLKESQNRIKTMAYIHESLYQNKTFSSVNFNEYLLQLTNNIIHSYSVNPEQIKLVLNCEKLILNLDSSIPLGLIINELVTNAIKHAFPGGRKGIISLNLTTQNKFVFLTVQDNGVGMRAEINPQSSGTLGLQLVYTLIDQIDGEITFGPSETGGTKVDIKLLV